MKTILRNFAILSVLILSLQAKAQLLEENFESGNFPPAGWNVQSGWGSITWSDYWGVSGYGNGDYSAYYDGYYWDGDVDSLITPVFGKTFGESLIFDFAYAPYDNSFRQRQGDGSYIYSDLYIYYRTDGDNEWYYLETIPGTTLQTAPPTSSFFEPSSSEWGTYSVQLPDFTVQIAIVADNFNSNSLYLDNVKVDYAPTGSDLAVRQVYGKGQYARPYLTGDTIRANIKNEGGVFFSNFYVYLELTGANNYVDSVLVNSLAVGQNIDVSFAPYTPVMNGPTQIRVYVQPDDVISNDEAFYAMRVNNNIMSYNDTTGSVSGGIGWFGEGYWLSRYSLTNANTRVKAVNVRITFGNANQVIRGVIVDQNGIMVAKSDPYRIKLSDEGNFVSLKLSDPVPHRIYAPNTSFYLGVEQTAIASTDDAYGIQSSQAEDPARGNTFYASTGLIPVGSPINYLFEWTSSGRWNIEAVIAPVTSADVGISNLGPLNEQYFNSATIQPKGRVHNNATSGSANATVIRRITPGGYTSSQNVVIPANSSVEVTFANWTFTSGTAYTVRDSIVLSGDTDLSDNVMSAPIIPRVAKDLAVVYSKIEDRDSLVRAIINDGRYASNFDTVPINYNGSLKTWKIVFMNARRSGNWPLPMRDSMKAYIDASTAANKKTLVMFHNASTEVDPSIAPWSSPADTIFLRQYLKAAFVGHDWQNNVPAGSKFKGKNYFSSVTQDSVYDYFSTFNIYAPDLIRPVNGSFTAFVPRSITGTGNDSAIAVAYAGPNYNTFFMSNQFHALRAKVGGAADGPVRIYARIIDWIQGTASNAKVLDLTMLLEGFYNQGINQMIGDSVRVFLRSASSPYPIVDSARGKLSQNGLASFVFNNASNGVNYYIQVKHRNALETWSKTAVAFTSNYRAYDFTTDSAKAYGNNMVKKGTRWVFYGGDVNQDGFIDGTDNNIVDNDAFNFIGGYVKSDLNGDDFVDASDYAISDNNAFNFIGKIVPPGASALVSGKGSIEADLPSISESAPQLTEPRIDHEIYERFKNSYGTRKPGLIQRNIGGTSILIAE